MSYRYIVGIDPDTEASGVAIIDREKHEVTISNHSFWGLIELMSALPPQETLWIIEDVWTTTANWHTRKYANASVNAKIGYAMGRCATIGRLIYERLHLMGADVIAQKALRKVWSRGKITHEETQALCRQAGLRLSDQRTNQEERDALLLALIHYNRDNK